MNSNERNILSNIYKVIISTLLLIPITMLVIHEFLGISKTLLIKEFVYPLIVISLVINITIWIKYYANKNYDDFQIHIKSFLRSSMTTGIILLMLLLPTLLSETEKKNVIEISFLISWLYYSFEIFKGYRMLNSKNENLSQEVEQIKCLKKIYLILFLCLIIIPAAMITYWSFSFFYMLIINIFIFEKYYRYNETNLFQAHIKSIFLTSIIITFIFFIPITINIQDANKVHGDQVIGPGLNLIGLTITYLIVYYYSLKGGYKEICD
jgi:hypothetical protein